MPRNNQGNYSLPQSPFVPGTVISSSAVNSNFSDIAAALTSSVAANGVTPITGQLQSILTASPTYSFNFDLTTGFGSTAAGTAAIWASGTTQITVTSSLVTINQPVTINGNLDVTGALTAGSIAFTGTGAVQIPVGTTGQRPATPAQGDIRYNSTTGNFEGYDGTEWQVMSNVTTAYQLTASVAAGILTVNVLNAKTQAAPTVADPLGFDFRPFNRTVILATSAFSINTNAIGATLGTSNNTPFRFWLVVVDSGGTPVPALINCSTPTEIFPLFEGPVVNTTGISAAATSAGVFYTPNGVATSGVYKILGLIEYSSGLGTAGNYTSTPSNQLAFTPGMKKPGDAVQVVYGTTTSATGTTSATFQITNTVLSISPTSSINLISAFVQGTAETGTGQGNSAVVQMARSSASSSPSNLFSNLTQINTVGAASQVASVGLYGLDAPGTTSATQYSVYIRSGGNTATWLPANQGSVMTLTELMG